MRESQPRGSRRVRVSAARGTESALPLRVFLAATPATWLRRRRDYVGNADVIHLLVQRRQILLGDFLDLCGSIVDQGSQLRQLFLLMAAGCGDESVQIIEQILDLIGQWVRLPFERGAGVS